MNFNSHLEEIRSLLFRSLLERKENLVSGLFRVLQQSSDLLKTDAYEYWLIHFNEMDWREFPITKYAVEEEKVKWEQVELNRKTISWRLHKTFENLLTYWDEDDLCDMQGQYYYYIDENSQEIFCESEHGSIRYLGQQFDIHTVRIATISELLKQGIINHQQIHDFFI